MFVRRQEKLGASIVSAVLTLMLVQATACANPSYDGTPPSWSEPDWWSSSMDDINGWIDLNCEGADEAVNTAWPCGTGSDGLDANGGLGLDLPSWGDILQELGQWPEPSSDEAIEGDTSDDLDDVVDDALPGEEGEEGEDETPELPSQDEGESKESGVDVDDIEEDEDEELEHEDENPGLDAADWSTVESDEDRDYEFSFRVPGVIERVEARIVGGIDGSSIEILKYPELVSFDLVAGALPLGFPDKIDSKYCAKIADHVDTIVEEADISESLKSMLHSKAGVRFSVPFLEGLTAGLRRYAGKEARELGATATAFDVVNPLELSELSLSVDFGSGSLTKKIGDAKAQTESLQSLLAGFSQSALRSGEFLASTHRPDFLCDLYQGNARIVVLSQADDHRIESVSRALSFR